MHQRGAIQTFPDKSDASDKIFTGGIDSKGEVTMTDTFKVIKI